MEKEIKLPKSFKKKWVAALRSGKYKQTADSLYRPEDRGYCCIGVAGSICGISNRSLSGKGIFSVGSFKENTINKYKKKGLPELLIGETNGVREELIDMNDSGNYDFDSIADYIDKYL